MTRKKSQHPGLSLEEALADLDLHPTDLTEPVDVDDLMRRYRKLDEQERHAREGKEEIKHVLSAFRDQGLIADKFSAQGYVGSLTTRTSYTYTQAVKDLQFTEKLEGLATQKTSTSWTIKEVKADD